MKLLSLLLIIAFLFLAPLGSVGSSPAGGHSVLTAIEHGPDEGMYILICRGVCEHHLYQAENSLTISVELPDVVSALTPQELPAPRGIVSSVTVNGGDGQPTLVIFTLIRPGHAMVTSNGESLKLRIGDNRFTSSRVGARDHTIGAEDLLEISVFEVPDLNRSVRVSERGTISLPLVGEKTVVGLTATELEGKLREYLSEKYIKKPHVSVFVKEYGSKKVSVIGAVGKPGVYEMLGPRTLLQVLSEAGGLEEDAGSELFVIRASNDGSTERIAVDVDDLMGHRRPELNLAILPGDVISVPIDEEIHIYVDGAVKNPGRIEQLSSRPISLQQAIAKAGGATDRADLKGIQILRRTAATGMQEVIKVNLKNVRKGKEPDPMLQEGDIVVVPETFF